VLTRRTSYVLTRSPVAAAHVQADKLEEQTCAGLC
jgi:hypothetical protein